MNENTAGIDRATRADELFRQGYNCAQAVLGAFSDITGFDLDASARMASSFGGGLGRLREVCGAVSAAALVLGIVKGYDSPTDRDAKKRHYALVREFAEKFKAKESTIICRELLTLAGLAVEEGNDPEQRKEEYYLKRPCPRLVYEAAEILDEMLAETAQ